MQATVSDMEYDQIKIQSCVYYLTSDLVVCLLKFQQNQAKLDHHKHCQISFGEYLQALNEPNRTNTQAPRTIDAIYLTVNLKIKGGMLFWILIWTTHQQKKSHCYTSTKCGY